MKNIETYFELIESLITKLGVDPASCRAKEPGQWNLIKGSANILVDIRKVPEKDYGYIQIIGQVCEFPVENRDVFMTEVLEMNHTLYGASFTKYHEWLFVRSIRELDGLDEVETMNMLQRVGNYSDEYDNYFRDKYFNGSGSRAPEK